jgi:major membrane immunogen (membrane-anchored lipoprotein)
MKFLTTILLATACCVGVAQAGGDIGGKYKVQGTNFDGTKYSGEATITITSETTCAIEWQTGADSSSEGICMRNDDSFAAAYKMKDGSVGLIIYKMAKNGTMDGVWTLTGKDGAGTEVLTPEK